MKVFDFSNGVKGKFLTELPRPYGLTGYPEVTDPTTGEVSRLIVRNRQQLGRGTELKVNTSAYNRNVSNEAYVPSTYGVDAILFCMGQVTCGTDTHWEWVAIGSAEWLAKAISHDFFI